MDYTGCCPAQDRLADCRAPDTCWGRGSRSHLLVLNYTSPCKFPPSTRHRSSYTKRRETQTNCASCEYLQQYLLDPIEPSQDVFLDKRGRDIRVTLVITKKVFMRDRVAGHALNQIWQVQRLDCMLAHGTFMFNDEKSLCFV